MDIRGFMPKPIHSQSSWLWLLQPPGKKKGINNNNDEEGKKEKPFKSYKRCIQVTLKLNTSQLLASAHGEKKSLHIYIVVYAGE